MNFFKERLEKVDAKPEASTQEVFIYTEDQLMARLRFFIGICLALTLTGIVFVVLYSIIFVTQPLNAISPIDQKFFELIIPIATFLTGTLSGIMLAGKDDKEARMKALDAANARPTVSPPPSSPSSGPMGGGIKAAPSFAPTAPAFPPASFAPAAPFAPADSFGGAPVVGFGGKLAPPPAPQPEI